MRLEQVKDPVGDVLCRWPMLGREAELDQIRAAYRRGASVLISGEPGVGKTRLAHALVDEASRTGWETEWVVASQAAASIPFAALAGMMPKESIGANGQGLLEALIDALQRRRGRKRLLVAVDDAHLLDDASAALVGLLATAAIASVVVTVRSQEPVVEPIARLARDGTGIRLDLQTVSSAEAAAVLEGALDGQVDQATTRRITDMADGNMLYLRELVVGGLISGTLQRNEGIWCWRGPLAPHRGLLELVAVRLEGLDPSERRTLETIAVGEPIELDLVGDSAPVGVLHRLEERGLVDVLSLGLTPFVITGHPLYGEVLRTNMSILRKAEVCASLAAGMETRPPQSDDDAVRFARWGLEAGSPPGPGVLLRAARRLLALSEPAAAAHLARAASEVYGGIEARLVLAEALRCQSDPLGAVEVLESLDGTNDAETVAIAGRLHGLYAWYLGAPDRAARTLADAEQKLTEAPARHQLMATRAALAMSQGQLGEAIDICDPLREPSVDESVQVSAGLISTTVWTLQGRFGWAIAEAERLRDGARRQALLVPWAPSQLKAARSLALCLSGELARVMQDALSGYQRALSRQDEEARGMCGIALGMGCLEQGRVQTAARYLREAVLVNRERGNVFTRSALLYLAAALALSGDAPGAGNAMSQAETLNVGLPSLYESESLRIRACIMAVAGRATEAQATAMEAAAVAVEYTAWSWAVWALHDAARWGAALARSQLEEIAPRVEGALALLMMDHAKALDADDPELLDDISCRFEALGFVLYAAEAAATASLAYGPRRRALALAAERRAGVLASQCEGAITPALRRSPRNPLSVREEEIAALAAAGMTDKDIAGSLHLSPRTVHAHLRNIYSKLGVANRRELCRHSTF